MGNRHLILLIGFLQCLIGFGPSLQANETTAALHLTLRDALAMAQSRYVEVLVGHERVQQAIARLGQARSALLPYVSAAGSETRQTRNLAASGITLPGREPLVGPFNTFDARIKVTQALFDAGAFQRLRAARTGESLSLADDRKVKQDAIALVAALYIEAQRATQRLESAHAILTRDQERSRIFAAQERLGVASALEVTQAQAALAHSAHRWRAAIAEAVERRLDLTAALGIPSQQPVVFVEEQTIRDRPLPSEEQALITAARHPQVDAAKQLVRTRQAEHAAEVADALPRLSVNADYGASGGTPSDSEGTYAFGAQITMPIFEGTRRYFRTRETSSLVRESQARLSDVEQHVTAQALSALESAKQARVLMQAAEETLAASIQEWSLAQSRRRNGLGSELEVIEAFSQAAQANDQREEAQAAYLLAQVNLAHAMGDAESLETEASR